MLDDIRRIRDHRQRVLELFAPVSPMARFPLIACVSTTTVTSRRHAVAVLSGLPEAHRTGLVRRRVPEVLRWSAGV